MRFDYSDEPRFNYSDEPLPPGLILRLKIKPWDTDLSPRSFFERESLGKVDTGADSTVIPERIRKDLGLLPTGHTNCKGAFDKEPIVRSTFCATILIGTEFSFDLEVISADGEMVLIGRDVLNQLVLHADGLFFELNKP